MNALARLWRAVARLAEGVERLGEIAHGAADVLQERLDYREPVEVLPDGAGNGKGQLAGRSRR